jgi:hypothetical protein
VTDLQEKRFIVHGHRRFLENKQGLESLYTILAKNHKLWRSEKKGFGLLRAVNCGNVKIGRNE